MHFVYTSCFYQLHPRFTPILKRGIVFVDANIEKNNGDWRLCLILTLVNLELINQISQICTIDCTII